MSISELEALDLQDNEDEVKENEEEFPRELGNNDNDENAAAALGHSRRISLVDEPHNIRPNRDGSISYALKFGRNGTGGGARGSLSQWKKPTHNRSRSRSRSAERPNRTSSKASEMAFRQSITPLDETAAHVETGATEPTSKDARNVPGPQDSNRDVPQKTFRLQPLKGSSDTDDVSSSGRSLADVDNETETISGVGRGREYDLRVSNANRMRSVAPSSNLPTPLQRAASVKGGFGQNTEGTGESSKPFGDTILSDCQKFWRKGGDGEGDLARHKIPAVLVDSLSSVLASSQHLIVEFPPDSRDSIYKAEEAALFITQTCRLLYGIRCSMIVFDESTPPEALISAGESRFRISRSPSRGLDQFDSTLSQPKHRGRTRSMEANSASIQVPDEGVIFSDIMVCHNLHLAPAETQAVVLEAMRMRLIGIGGHKRDLSSNFCVVATYESPSSGKSASVMPSLSRHFRRHFLLSIQVEENHVSTISHFLRRYSIRDVEATRHPLIGMKAIRNLSLSLPFVFICNALRQYSRDIVVASRQHPVVAIGPGPRCFWSLQKAAKLRALLSGFTFARPVDVDDVAVDSLSHLLLLRSEVEGGARHILNELVFQSLSPPK